MPQNTVLFAIISAAIYLLGVIPYSIGIVRWKILPHVFSYWTWAILVGINLSLLSNSSSGWSILPASIQFAFLIAFAISGLFVLKKIHINWFDYSCLFFAIFAGVIWMYGPQEYAAIASTLVDFIAMLPTVKKVWLQPHSEQVLPWLNAWIFPIFLILASREHTFSNTIFWIYIIVANIGLSLFLLYRQKRVPA